MDNKMVTFVVLALACSTCVLLLPPRTHAMNILPRDHARLFSDIQNIRLDEDGTRHVRDTDRQTPDDSTTDDAPFALNFTAGEIGTTWITVSWTLAEETPSCRSLVVRTTMMDSTPPGVVVVSPALSCNTTQYTIRYLGTDARYTVCLHEDDVDDKVDEVCVSASTIPLMRMDSALAVCGAILFVLLLIFCATLCWCRAKRKYAELEEAEEFEDEAGSAGSEDDHADAEKGLITSDGDTNATPRTTTSNQTTPRPPPPPNSEPPEL